MIVNLAESTMRVIKDAGLDAQEIEYVGFYNDDDEQHQTCTFQEFIEIAEDINFDEFDPTIVGRRIIKETVEIVAEGWWLRRTVEGDDVESWVYSRLPKTIDETELGDGELHADYIINNVDNYDDDYVELVKHESPNKKYVKSDKITIGAVEYQIIDDDGVDKIVVDNHVLVVIGSGQDNKYATINGNSSLNPNLIFSPAMIKHVFDTMDITIDLNDELIYKLTNVRDAGFDDHHTTSLRIVKVRRGVDFTINTIDDVETIEYIDNIQWQKG